MKKHPFTLSFLLIIATIPAYAGVKEDIIEKVHRWNELHNTRETFQFKNLYASNVLFYGRNNSRQQCYRKKTAFLNNDFYQEIISPIQLTYYSSGKIKATFTKRVTYKKTIKEHYCYLLFEKEEGDYHISGESDLQTDENLGVSLSLGAQVAEKEFEGAGINGTFIAFGLAILLIVALLFYRSRRKKAAIPTETFDASPSIVTEPVFEQSPVQELVKDQKAERITEQKAPPPLTDNSLHEQMKGHAFECYVVERFSKEYFNLLEWRSDKYHEGRYAESNKLPDLEYRFTTSYHDFPIAIECKWRAEFFKGRIEWAKSYQLSNYRRYERERGIPVYVIVGIGGQPNDPASVYIIPLPHIRSNVLTERDLQKYFRHVRGTFFLDGNTMMLS